MRVIHVETKPCPMCGRRSGVTMPRAAFESWQDGTLLQLAWPEATSAERELLITGTHPECWDQLRYEEEE